MKLIIEKDLNAFDQGIQWLQNDVQDCFESNLKDFKNNWNDFGSSKGIKTLFGNVTGCCSKNQEYSNQWCLFEENKLNGRTDRITLKSRFELEDGRKMEVKVQKNTTISRQKCNLMAYVTCSPRENNNFVCINGLGEYN